MPFERPTLRALGAQALADMASVLRVPAILRASPVAILAKACAGLVHGLYGYLDWIARQAVPFTATGEFLAAWAALVGILRKAPSAATGTAVYGGTVGAVLPEGTELVRQADGALFRTTALAVIGSDSALIVPVVALEAGAAGNGTAGATLVIRSAVLGVNAAGTAGLITGGADEERGEDFRQRMLDRFRAPPQGGAVADYETWARAVPGVTRAWIAPNGMGAGTVVVYAMLDDAQAGAGGFPQGADGVAAAETRATPATGDQLTIADALYPLRPATALVYVVAPTPYPVDYVITDLAQDSVGTRTAIAEALRGMFRRQGAPGGQIFQSDSIGAIAGAEGVTRFNLVSPGLVQAPPGALPVLGTISWS
ncbi:baseplate J/gp47 family protein [Teichococcus aestuarii]|uniref:baseplate J/gp47 family protein n=1 Tax=Teichococcus aestuarii TaxID=568898 RepID=UPI00361FB2EC